VLMILSICLNRVLKNEYRRTRNQAFGKARFPLLLSQLWETDAVKSKTNIVKSFMKAGVFPFNRASIDRSRILLNPLVHAIDSTSDRNGCDPDPIVVASVATSSIGPTVNDQSLVDASSTSNRSSLTFNSSHEAISELNSVLEAISAINDDGEDSDEDYVPENPPSKATVNSNRLVAERATSKKMPTLSDQRKQSAVVVRVRGRRKRSTAPMMIGFSSSDDESTYFIR
jgi:hypothetical protein